MKALQAAAPRSSRRGDPRVRRGGARRAHRHDSSRDGTTSRSPARRSARCTSRRLPDGREVAVKVQHPGVVAGGRERPRERRRPRGVRRRARGQALRAEEDVRHDPRALPRGARLRPRGRAASRCSRASTRAIRPCAFRGSSRRTARRGCSRRSSRAARPSTRRAPRRRTRGAPGRRRCGASSSREPGRRSAQRRSAPRQLHLPRRRRRHLPRLRLRPGVGRARTGSRRYAFIARRSRATRPRSDAPWPRSWSRSPGRSRRLAIAYTRQLLRAAVPVAVPHHAPLRGEPRRRDEGDGVARAQGPGERVRSRCRPTCCS